jgi:hypothetical protein
MAQRRLIHPSLPVRGLREDPGHAFTIEVNKLVYIPVDPQRKILRIKFADSVVNNGIGIGKLDGWEEC